MVTASIKNLFIYTITGKDSGDHHKSFQALFVGFNTTRWTVKLPQTHIEVCLAGTFAVLLFQDANFRRFSVWPRFRRFPLFLCEASLLKWKTLRLPWNVLEERWHESTMSKKKWSDFLSIATWRYLAQGECSTSVELVGVLILRWEEI